MGGRWGWVRARRPRTRGGPPRCSTPRRRRRSSWASTARPCALSPWTAAPRWTRFALPSTSASTAASMSSALRDCRGRTGADMGSIESYETAKGRCYRALYRRPDRKQTQKRGFTTKKAAELFLGTTEVDIAQGRYLDPSRAKVTVAEWLHTWLAARGGPRAPTPTRGAKH